MDGSKGVYVRNNTEITTNARELWYGKPISYHFTKANLPDLERILREISPYTYFKEGQFEVLCKMVSARKHTVCIMPTGSGKSLIYYMISILQPLPLFIVAPTDILIDDQIRNLKQIHHIDNVSEAVEMMASESDYIILDVRRPDEFATGHIPNAINIPNESIGTDEISELPDKDQLILVYCRSGNRSKQASQKLVKLGYSNVVEFGGINDWKGEIEK